MTQRAPSAFLRPHVRLLWAWPALLFAVLMSGCGGGGGGDVLVPAPVPPGITAQPTSASVVVGAAATFSVSATGDGLTFQWQRSTDAALTWVSLAGASAASYTIAVVDASLNGYQYRAIVTGTGGSVMTSPVTLTVAAAPTPPTISVQPASQSVAAGANATFAVTAAGTSLSYQWQSGPDGATWSNLAGATSATVTLNNVAISDSGKHLRVVVSANDVTVNSDGLATLTVTAAPTIPVITAQPVAASVIVPQAASFLVMATASPAPSYQWQVSADGTTYNDISGATDAGYVIAATASADNGKLFRVRVSNAAGSVISDAARLNAASTGVAPLFVTQPVTQDLLVGAKATFTVATSGTPTPALQWQIGSVYTGVYTNINGATSTTYTTPVLGLGDGGNLYRAVATNTFGFANSSPALTTLHYSGGVGINPVGVAVDGSGNVLISANGTFANNLGMSTTFSGVEKFSSAGVLSVVAGGSATNGFIDGQSTFARFGGPAAITLDATGNTYVADSAQIRKITPAGLVSTIAGSVGGFADGTGSAAKFFGAAGVAVDGAGTVYVADTQNQAIRMITPAGVVTTLAGTNPAVRGFVDGTAANARFSSPSGLAIDAAGNLYVADTANNAIRKIAPGGVVTTFAGAATETTPGSLTNAGFVDGPATTARFNAPVGVAVDSVGNVYVVDRINVAIRKITPAGVVTTLAGGASGYVDATGTAAKFVNLQGIAVDSSGNVFVTDWSYVPNGLLYRAIRKISPAGVVTTVTN